MPLHSSSSSRAKQDQKLSGLQRSYDERTAGFKEKHKELNAFIESHKYPLTEEETKTIRDLVKVRNERAYEAQHELYKITIDNSDDPLVAPLVDEKVNELNKMQLQLSLELRKLDPQPSSTDLATNADVAIEKLKSRLGSNIPKFESAQKEADYHVAYRDAISAHTALYARIRSNKDLKRESENTPEILEKAEKLRQTISEYENKYMGREQYNTTLEVLMLQLVNN